MQTTKILIIGLGDLGRRLALLSAFLPASVEVVLASRMPARGEAFASLVAGCHARAVRFAPLDGTDLASVCRLLDKERPRLILQCASLMSPWALHERKDVLAQALLAAGFALQLPAQLPVVTTVMQALQRLDLDCPVVNCSYPDVTHAVLATAGLAPALGIGNAGMIQRWMRARLGNDASHRLVRVLAHHAHVGATMTGQARRGTTAPRIFVDYDEIDVHALPARPGVAQGRELNALSAAHAMEIISAFLPEAPTLRTSAPGPLGMPGGWPVCISDHIVTLDLPPALNRHTALRHQIEAARDDGIERIEDDGTVHFTDALQSALPLACQALGAPLHRDEVMARFAALHRTLESTS